MVDLHSHSTASDGRLQPRALVELAHERGLHVLALTDHDTVAGLDEAHQACQDHGLTFVPGIELEIDFEPGEFHLLGLGLRQWKTDWVEGLIHLQQQREHRNRKIFSRMLEAGIRADYQEIQALAQGGQIGRPHFAQFLVARGKVDTVQTAFDQFLGRGQIFYEARERLPLSTALAMIHQAGGLAIVAHPMSLRLSWPEIRQQLIEWQALGLDGLEAWHPGALPRHCRRLEALGRELGLKITAGSDFHGEMRPDRKLGWTSGRQPIADRFYLETGLQDQRS